MKYKKTKYNEGVRRNIESARRAKKNKYSGLMLKFAKRWLGIADDDDSFDAEVKELISK